jgi:hypothetical protein
MGHDGFRRNHGKFELEATRAGYGGYPVRILRQGPNVQTICGNEKGWATFGDPDSELDDASDSQRSQGSLNDRDIG